MLEGVDAHDLSIAMLRDLCDLLAEGAQRSARLVAEGRSVARGTVPSWISSAADVRVSRFERGSLDLGVRAVSLVDAAPEIFAQQQLFPVGTDASATAMDLFLDAADDATNGRRESERLDTGVLEVLSRAGNLFSRGCTRLSISRSGTHSVVIDPTNAATIRALADATPPSRVARVAGVLDSLTVSTQLMGLRLADGHILRGYAGDVGIDKLRSLLGHSVVLEGITTFRPSGDALRMQVESAALATSGDVIWERLPHVDAVLAKSRATVAPSGLDAFFGKWPGDETDRELAAALQDEKDLS